MFSQKLRMSMSLWNGVSRSLLWLYAGHLLQVLRQELGAEEHQKKLNWAQEEAMSWQIAKKKKSKKNVKDKSSAAFFPSAPGKDLIRKGPNKKKYWRQNTQTNSPCFSDERCRYENSINKRVRGWTSGWRLDPILCWAGVTGWREPLVQI